MVDSISPSFGNYLGGVLLTINGSNFSEFIKENVVLIGAVPCEVISASLTELKCITGVAAEDTPGSTEIVTVKSKKGLDATTNDESKLEYTFTFMELPPKLIKILSNSIEYYLGEEI